MAILIPAERMATSLSQGKDDRAQQHFSNGRGEVEGEGGALGLQVH